MQLKIRKPQKTSDTSLIKKSNATVLKKMLRYKYFYLMALPVVVITFIFYYMPMYGIKFAFTKYGPFAPAKFIGLDNFRTLFKTPQFLSAFRNTITLSLLNLFVGMIVTIVFALLLNEVKNKFAKSFVQTLLYLPHFLSWVVVASIFTIILSPQDGFINQLLVQTGHKPFYFLVSEKWWTPIFVFIARWKDTGWGTIIYLAALSGISPELYEAASIDGASRLKQCFHVTIPGIMNTILVIFILDLAKVLNLFDSVFNLMNPLVYSVSDTIQTYTFRVMSQQADYGYTTAVGLFKSVIALVLVLAANKISKKIKGSSIL
ncbi:ABC transporter permease [Clostridium estertheticum]|uniref:ABC transporter permease n=1 Tax=Clostridium estertheticum TaxID=238834 RepID=UPI001CF5232B|nr:ABC transporter permease subunit [Clostridium estertheticum]MCB2352783.1 ABC transporter permease subunit [Clostridium estertheticum]WAG40089.1 ABC transporter permease subunit [Clostridium estertheticum]